MFEFSASATLPLKPRFDNQAPRPKLGRMGRILGVDFGEARTGLAFSDESETIATALPAWDRKGKLGLVEHLQSLISQHGIGKIVLGFPRNMDGSVGRIAEQVLKIKEDLSRATDLPILLWDERLSSVSAHRFLKENKLSSKKDKKVVDTISAVLILQSYLDSQRK